MSFWIKQKILTGVHVELIPLTAEHESELVEAATDGELWNLWYTGVPSPKETKHYIDTALKAKAQKGELPFVIRHIATDRIIGCSRFCNVDNKNKRAEIGYTWYAKTHQATSANTESKSLLLGYAFEQLNAIAIEFRTHWMNMASRKAIASLGAKQDGVLRNHQQMEDGSFRDTVVFSIIQSEWLSVKNHISYKLDKFSAD